MVPYITNCMAGIFKAASPEGLFRGGPELGVYLLEFGGFVISAYIGFYYPDGSQIFLDDPVDLIHGTLHPGVERPYMADDEKQHNAQNRGSH